MLEPQATVIKWQNRIRQEHGFGPCRCKACQIERQANANENEHKQTLKAEDIMQCFPAEWPSDLREAFRKEATAITQPAKPILEKWSALPTAKPAKAKATKLRANGWAEQVDTD